MRVVFSIFIFLSGIFGADITGYYILPKNEHGLESVVRVFEKDNKYYAYGFTSKDNADFGYDVKNPNKELQKRRVKGSVFVWNLQKKSEDKYVGGKVYNYVNGKTYYAKAEVKGDDLVIRASSDSVGMFGKTIIWKKLSKEEVEPYLSRDVDLKIVEETIPQD